MSETTNSRGLWIRVRLYSSVVIVCLSMLVMGAGPKLLPEALLSLLGWEDMATQRATQWVELYNLPLWFMTVTGVIELGAGLLVLHSRTRLLGGLLAAATMLGAALVNVLAGEFSNLITNAFILVAALIVIGSSKDQFLALLGRA